MPSQPYWRDLLDTIEFEGSNDTYRILRNTFWDEHGQPSACTGCCFDGHGRRCAGPDIDDDVPCIFWAADFDVADVIFERVGGEASPRKCGRKWPKFLPD